MAGERRNGAAGKARVVLGLITACWVAHATPIKVQAPQDSASLPRPKTIAHFAHELLHGIVAAMHRCTGGMHPHAVSMSPRLLAAPAGGKPGQECSWEFLDFFCGYHVG